MVEFIVLFVVLFSGAFLSEKAQFTSQFSFFLGFLVAGAYFMWLIALGKFR